MSSAESATFGEQAQLTDANDEQGKTVQNGPWDDQHLCLATALADERARLVRLCAHLIGNADAAEDLAQETLIEAWRHADNLHDPNRTRQWLSGIARNVCRRWSVSRARETARIQQAHRGDETCTSDAVVSLVDSIDLEVELERDDLALLPPATRTILVQRFIDERSHAEIGERLGLSEGAVAVRVHRGKLALRRAFAHPELGEAAATYGLVRPSAAAWQETRIWCPYCGRQRLMGRLSSAKGEFLLRCSWCCPDARQWIVDVQEAADILGTIKSYRPALSRLAIWLNEFYRLALDHQSVPCPRCGLLISFCRDLPENATLSGRDDHGIQATCSACGNRSYQRLSSIALGLAEGRRFWKRHPRLFTLPERRIESGGRDAIVTGFRSVSGHAALDVVFDAATFRLVDIHGAPSVTP